MILTFVFITRECCYDRSTRRVSMCILNNFFKLLYFTNSIPNFFCFFYFLFFFGKMIGVLQQHRSTNGRAAPAYCQ